MISATAAATIGPYTVAMPSAIATPASKRPAPSAGAIQGRNGMFLKFCDGMGSKLQGVLELGADVVG